MLYYNSCTLYNEVYFRVPTSSSPIPIYISEASEQNIFPFKTISLSFGEYFGTHSLRKSLLSIYSTILGRQSPFVSTASFSLRLDHKSGKKLFHK